MKIPLTTQKRIAIKIPSLGAGGAPCAGKAPTSKFHLSEKLSGIGPTVYAGELVCRITKKLHSFKSTCGQHIGWYQIRLSFLQFLSGSTTAKEQLQSCIA